MKTKILIILIILIGLGAVGGVYWYQKEKRYSPETPILLRKVLKEKTPHMF